MNTDKKEHLVQRTWRVTESIAAELRVAACHHNTSIESIVRDALRRELDRLADHEAAHGADVRTFRGGVG